MSERSLSYHRRVSTSRPSSRRAPALPPDERRATLIEAVIPLLLAHGERVTSKQIACAAGVSEGTIFRAFEDKADLVSAALKSTLDTTQFENELTQIDPNLGFDEALVAATQIFQDRLCRVWALLSCVGPEMRHAVSKPGGHSPALAKIFEAHPGSVSVDPTEAVALLRGMTLALTHPLMSEKPAPPEKVVDFFLNGVSKQHATKGKNI